MAYKCVHCSEIYEDSSSEVLSGCSKCKRKFFFYIKNEKLEELEKKKEEEKKLSAGERKQIESDVRELVGIRDEETPVFLDFESIKIVKPGKYLLDLQKLFAKEGPKVYKLDDGKYIIDLNTPISNKKRI